MTAPVRLVAVGIGKETTYGTAVAPVLLLPRATLEPVDNNNLLLDTSWRGSAVTTVGHETGTLDSAVHLAGPIHPDAIGFFLAGILGDVAFTGGSPNTFGMAVLNTGTQQPPSYTVSVADPVGNLQWAGCKMAALKLSFDAGSLLKYDAQMVGIVSTVPGSLSMPAPSTEKVIPGWVGALQVGGSSEPRLLSAEIVLSRIVVAKRNATGAQAPWLQRTAALSVNGSLEFAVSTDAYRSLFLGGTSTSIDLNYSQGAGAALRQLKLHCSSAVLTSAARSYGAKWVEIAVDFEAEATTADAGASGGRSPVKVTLKNAIGSGVYA